MSIISIIVPIYNQEKHLDKSIGSLISQEYSNLEIILVNDGSTDNSFKIIKDYKKKDHRIKVIDKSNGGVSSARNAGLEIATGEYIGFIDPDDWIDSIMYKSMYNNLMTNEAEVVMCNYLVEKSNQKKEIKIDTNKKKLNKNEIIDFLIADMINMDTLNISSPSIMGSVCRMLIKREIIYKNNIKFNKNIPYMEDLLFVIEILFNTNIVGIEHRAYYHYNQIDNSASNKYLPNFLENHYEVWQGIKNIIIRYDYYEKLKDRLRYRYIFMIMHSIKNETMSGNDKNRTEKIRTIKNIMDDSTLDDAIKNIDYQSYSVQRKAILYSIKNKNAMMLYVYYRLTNILRKKNII